MNQPELNSEIIFRKNVAKPVLFSILILVSGIFIGSGITLIISKQIKPKNPPGPEYISKRFLDHMIRELQLSDQQQAQIKPIVQKHMKAMETIRNDARPKISDELQQMNEDILAVLGEPQKQLWQDRIHRMQKHFSPGMHQRRGPGYEQRGRRGPDFRPDDSRPPRRFQHRRPPEGMERPDDINPGSREGFEPIPEEPRTE